MAAPRQGRDTLRQVTIAPTQPADAGQDPQAHANAALWAQESHVRAYDRRDLRPVEVMLLVRYREQFRGRVLDLGCGAGRLTGYLYDLAEEVHGLDVSPAMVAHCRAAYPRARFSEGDVRDLSGLARGSFDAVLAAFNLIDVLGETDRPRVLEAMGRLLSPSGLLIFSSHNLASAPLIARPTHVRWRDPLRAAADVVRMPRRWRNHRRLRPYERAEGEWAIRNDTAHDFLALHHYVSWEFEQRQLAGVGLTLLECLDLDGRRLLPGEDAPNCPELHYVAQLTRRDDQAVT